MASQANRTAQLPMSPTNTDGFSLRLFCADLLRNLQNEFFRTNLRANETLARDGSEPMDGPIVLKSYTVATVPSASEYTQGLIYVSNEAGGAVPAFSDGTNWRRVTDRAIVS